MNTAEERARDFLTRVDELMTPDYVIHSGGKTIRVRDGRLAECWVEREPPRYRGNPSTD